MAPADRLTSSRAGRLDVMRLVFAMFVLLSHSSEYIDGNRGREPLTGLFHTLSLGEVAVDGFFLLSGLLITQSWLRSPDAVTFMRKRAMRLYPAFIVASVLAILVVGRLGAVRPETYYADIDLRMSAIRLVLLMQPITPAIFAGAPYPFVNTAAWTIQYEMFCYIIVAVLGTLGILKHRRVVSAMWLALLALEITQHVAVGATAGPAVLYGPLADPLRCVMLFFSGMIFALFGFHRRGGRQMLLIAAAAMTVGLCVPLLAEPMVATAGGYLLLRFGCTPAAWKHAFPDLSYGTYLYGAPVEMLLIHFFPGVTPMAVFACAVPLALLLGFASWRWIEEPALRRYSGGARGRSLAYC